MAEFVEGKLKFTFPEVSYSATQYDSWSFYRNQLSNNAFGGSKAVDFICVEDGVTWLIEVKDYRRDRRTKAIDLPLEVAQKVRDTLAGLAAARCNANDSEEERIAILCLIQKRLRVVLHLEQPANPGKLFPQAIDPAKAKQKLKQLLKAVDPHPLVVDKNRLPATVHWQVESVSSDSASSV
ncbi:MAG: hypothetical protein ACR2PT_04330 [Endozoicomonas sp.]